MQRCRVHCECSQVESATNSLGVHLLQPRRSIRKGSFLANLRVMISGQTHVIDPTFEAPGAVGYLVSCVAVRGSRLTAPNGDALILTQ